MAILVAALVALLITGNIYLLVTQVKELRQMIQRLQAKEVLEDRVADFLRCLAEHHNEATIDKVAVFLRCLRGAGL